MNMPGFCAEVSLYSSNSPFYNTSGIEMAHDAVSPAIQCGTVTLGCGGDVACMILDTFCGELGGGMASEPGGGASCHIPFCE